MYSKFKNIIKLPVRHFSSSALFVTGDKAQNVFSVLTPHIDFDERIQNKQELLDNIKLRSLSIDVDKIEKQWAFYKHIDDTKNVLEETKTALGKEIASLLKNPEGKEDEIEKLKAHAKLTKNDYKNVREYLYGIEEMAVLKVLALPNVLHSRTPATEPYVLYEHKERDLERTSSHIDLVSKNDWFQFSQPSFVYLKNEAAFFELAMINYVNNFMLDTSFMQFANSNFARSVVVEGCGTDFFNKNEVFTLENAATDESNDVIRTHLTGGASLYSFMAYFTRHMLQLAHLPLKFFTIGRTYIPSQVEANSLLNLSQYTQINCFLATIDDDNHMNEEFDDFVDIIKCLYESLGYHYRLVYLPAKEINKNESLRLSIQMYSNFLDEYVEVGYVSIYGDFISKRLLFNYKENKERKFPKVISGNILNIHKVLACAIENNAVTGNDCLLNDLLKQYIPIH